MSPAAPLLEIENLVVEIQSMPALRGFSLHVDKGAMVGLVGGQDHIDAFDHGSSQAGTRRTSI